jgi:MFS family permease
MPGDQPPFQRDIDLEIQPLRHDHPPHRAGETYHPARTKAESTTSIDTLKAFGVFFIGFVARPISAAIFGHYGDRIGRKATLIVTLLMTGIATAAVGLVPGYDMIGIWGAVILTLLRLIQGIGVGGE